LAAVCTNLDISQLSLGNFIDPESGRNWLQLNFKLRSREWNWVLRRCVLLWMRS